MERVGAGQGQLGRRRRSPQEAQPLPGLCGRWVNSIYPLGASPGLPSVTSWFSVPPSLPATTLRPELCPGGGGDLPHWGLTVSQVSGPSGKAASSKTSCSPSCLPVQILDFSPWATCCCSGPPPRRPEVPEGGPAHPRPRLSALGHRNKELGLSDHTEP